MTVIRLSAQSVKVQLTADERKLFLTEPAAESESPQMLLLIAFMLNRAEAASGIPFSELPVTVELLTSPQGGLIAYFTAQPQPKAFTGSRHIRISRIAAQFGEEAVLQSCCTQLNRRSKDILSSMLYRYKSSFVLTLRLRRGCAAALHHVLLEYGTPFRLSALNRARLTEYGTCLCEKNAVETVCSGHAPRSSRTASAGESAPSK